MISQFIHHKFQSISDHQSIDNQKVNLIVDAMIQKPVNNCNKETVHNHKLVADHSWLLRTQDAKHIISYCTHTEYPIGSDGHR
jgi:hypothetical protein